MLMEKPGKPLFGFIDYTIEVFNYYSIGIYQLPIFVWNIWDEQYVASAISVML